MKQYLDALQHVLDHGEKRTNRTGVDTIQVFGYQCRYDLRRGYPAVTTKKLQFKSVVKELLWFLRGETNIKTLGCGIWNEWSNKEDGEVSYCYGQMWRAYPGPADPDHGDDVTKRLFTPTDQIQGLIDRIERDPDSRRHIINAWHPQFADKAGLAWCHMNAHFSVTDEWVDCIMQQRSCDLALGVPFNVASYALLTHMVAARVGRKARHFVHNMNDMHIYSNHVDVVKEQLKRVPKDAPQLILRADPKTELWDYQVEDIDLANYQYHPPLSFLVAV